MEKYSDFIYRNRYLVILFTLLLTFAIAFGASKLRMDNDYRTFFKSDNPELVAFDFIQETYTKSENVLVVLVPKEGGAFSKDTLKAVQWLTEKSWLLPYSSRVDSISNYQHTESEGDEMTVAELYEDVDSLTPEQQKKIADVVLNEPLLIKRLISEEGHATGVNITFNIPEGADNTVVFEEIADSVKQLRTELKQSHPDIDTYLTGIVMMNQAFAEAGLTDFITLTPTMYLVVILILLIMLRTTLPVVGTVMVIFLSILISYGFAGWAGMKMTSPLFSVMNIVLTLAVADCVHMLMTFVLGMRNGLDKITAMKESMRINSWPIFLTSITTAIGFLTLNFSETPPFQDLGNASAAGVIAAWFLCMTFLPAFIFSVPVKIKPQETKENNLMARFAEFVIDKRKAILIVYIPVSLVILSFVIQNDLNDDFVQYFDERIEFRTDTDAAYANLTGINNIQYSLPAADSNGIASPEYLKTLEEFVEWHRKHPIVMNVNTINDVLKRLNKNMHGDDQTWFKVPDNQELAAQYLLLYEMSLPYGLDLNDQLDVDKSATRVVITTKNVTNNEILALADEGKQWLKDNAPEYMHSIGASPTIMFANVAKRNITTMLGGTTIALLLISFILIFALRSLKVGLLSLIPNLLPIGLAFGVWGILVGQVGLASSIVAAICMGIVVDDTVHFLSKYLRARNEKGLSPEDSIRYAFSTVGIALWVTSLVLVLGFLVLAYSSFAVNSQLGQLTFLTISLALITDFVLLPPLLLIFDRDKGGQAADQAES